MAPKLSIDWEASKLQRRRNSGPALAMVVAGRPFDTQNREGQGHEAQSRLRSSPEVGIVGVAISMRD